MSATQESLSDILSGKEPAAEVAAPEPKGETSAAPPAAGSDAKEADKAQTRGEDGKFKADKPAEAAPPAEDKSKPRADVAAIIDERRKRQALQRELDTLKAGKPQEKPSVFENEDEAIRSRVNEETRPMREAVFDISMQSARVKHGEGFNEAEEAFMEAAEADPRLYDELRNARNPGEFVFSRGIFAKKLSPHGGDIMRMLDHETGSLKGQVTERDTRIKALEAQVAELTQQKADLEALPRSLNSRPSGASPQAGAGDDEDIKSIARFGNQKR